MPRIRQQNVLAAQWAPNGGALGALWLVNYLAGELYPARRLRIVVLFGWSPLLLFESVGNGHNDIVMMVFVLGALLLMAHRYARTAFAFRIHRAR